MLDIAKITVSSDYKYAQYFLPKNLDKLFQKWSFESLFELSYWPLYKENIIDKVSSSLECKSFDTIVIESDHEISITGIYEAKLDGGIKAALITFIKEPLHQNIVMEIYRNLNLPNGT